MQEEGHIQIWFDTIYAIQVMSGDVEYTLEDNGETFREELLVKYGNEEELNAKIAEICKAKFADM